MPAAAPGANQAIGGHKFPVNSGAGCALRASILLGLAPVAEAKENLGSRWSNVSYNSELS
jgi:hypothetical protein